VHKRPNDDISDERKQWEQLDCMFLNSELYLDISKEEYYEKKKTSDSLKRIIKMYPKGTSVKLGAFPDTFDDHFFQKINPHSIFLLSDEKECKKYKNKYGMFFISTTEIFQSRITKSKDVQISKTKQQHQKWGEILHDFKHPCNSMIIADNYILKGNNNKIEENLLPILRALLPDMLTKKIFHLTIITEIDSGIKEKYDSLNAKLKKLREYKVSLKIIGNSKDIHDRDVITNDLRINSGAGFLIFNNESVETNTRIIIEFINNSNVFENVNTLTEQYCIIEKNANNVGTEIVVMPESESGKLTTPLLKTLTNEI
jgi:hypothetical protein